MCALLPSTPAFAAFVVQSPYCHYFRSFGTGSGGNLGGFRAHFRIVARLGFLQAKEKKKKRRAQISTRYLFVSMCVCTCKYAGTAEDNIIVLECVGDLIGPNEHLRSHKNLT